MSAVERYDAETEAEIAAGWIPVERADEYRARRLRTLERAACVQGDAARAFLYSIQKALRLR